MYKNELKIDHRLNVKPKITEIPEENIDENHDSSKTFRFDIKALSIREKRKNCPSLKWKRFSLEKHC